MRRKAFFLSVLLLKALFLQDIHASLELLSKDSASLGNLQPCFLYQIQRILIHRLINVCQQECDICRSFLLCLFKIIDT